MGSHLKYRIKVDKQPYCEEVFIPQFKGLITWSSFYELDEAGDWVAVSFPSEHQAKKYIEDRIQKMNTGSPLHKVKYIYL